MLPWTPKVAPLGVGTLFKDPLRDSKGHIELGMYCGNFLREP